MRRCSVKAVKAVKAVNAVKAVKTVNAVKAKPVSEVKGKPVEEIIAPNAGIQLHTFVKGIITVTTLNNLISSLYTSEKIEVDVVSPLNPIFKIIGANRMFSSGQSNDCLIHSLLTVSCPAFREISQGKKNKFADVFRRTILPYLANEKTLLLKEVKDVEIQRFINDCKSSGFLSDKDLSIICKLFTINVLLLEIDRPDNVGKMHPHLASLVLSSTTSRSDPYIIYGSGVHFEGVRLSSGLYQYNYADAELYVKDQMRGNVKPNGKKTGRRNNKNNLTMKKSKK